MVRRVLVALLVAAALAALLIYSQWRPPPQYVSGFVEADQIRLGSRVGGRVAEVYVSEGSRVAPGDPILRLEPFDLAERRAQAQAELASAEAELARLLAGFRAEEIAQAAARVDRLDARLRLLEAGPRPEEIAAGQARKRLAEAQLTQAKQFYDRTAELFAKEQGVVTRDDVDRAIEGLQVAEANLDVATQELIVLEKGAREEEKDAAKAEIEEARQAHALAVAGYRAEDVARAQATRDAAAAAGDALEQQLAELTVKAATPGVVEAFELRPGDLVGAGAPVVAISDTTRLWVRAYVPENRLSLQVDDPVEVTIDSYPGRKFRARITYISPEAEFTPSNVQTPEERSKQVFRIKATLEEGLDELRPGMSADVWLGE